MAARKMFGQIRFPVEMYDADGVEAYVQSVDDSNDERMDRLEELVAGKLDKVSPDGGRSVGWDSQGRLVVNYGSVEAESVQAKMDLMLGNPSSGGPFVAIAKEGAVAVMPSGYNTTTSWFPGALDSNDENADNMLVMAGQLNDKLADKLDKGGGTMTGNLKVQSGDESTIELSEKDKVGMDRHSVRIRLDEGTITFILETNGQADSYASVPPGKSGYIVVSEDPDLLASLGPETWTFEVVDSNDQVSTVVKHVAVYPGE